MRRGVKKLSVVLARLLSCAVQLPIAHHQRRSKVRTRLQRISGLLHTTQALRVALQTADQRRGTMT